MAAHCLNCCEFISNVIFHICFDEIWIKIDKSYLFHLSQSIIILRNRYAFVSTNLVCKHKMQRFHLLFASTFSCSITINRIECIRGIDIDLIRNRSPTKTWLVPQPHQNTQNSHKMTQHFEFHPIQCALYSRWLDFMYYTSAKTKREKNSRPLQFVCSTLGRALLHKHFRYIAISNLCFQPKFNE